VIQANDVAGLVLTTGDGYRHIVRRLVTYRVPGALAPGTQLQALEGPGRAFAEQSGEDDRSAQEQRKENSLPHGTASLGCVRQPLAPVVTRDYKGCGVEASS